MISLYDGQFTDILPGNLKDSAEVQALSYAVSKTMQKLLTCSQKVMLYSAIDSLPEKLIDILAVELRVQYYDETGNIDVKRELVRNALILYSFAGTNYAVENIVEAVLGSGSVTEWYEYGGAPGHFRITTENSEISTADIELFNKIIKSVKRKSAILDAIEINLDAIMNNLNGTYLHTVSYSTLVQEG